jgi:organic radical activating enzyme
MSTEPLGPKCGPHCGTQHGRTAHCTCAMCHGPTMTFDEIVAGIRPELEARAKVITMTGGRPLRSAP